MSYDKRDVEVVKTLYNPLDVRTWPYYPIIMPLKKGQGPATDARADPHALSGIPVGIRTPGAGAPGGAGPDLPAGLSRSRIQEAP